MLAMRCKVITTTFATLFGMLLTFGAMANNDGDATKAPTPSGVAIESMRFFLGDLHGKIKAMNAELAERLDFKARATAKPFSLAEHHNERERRLAVAAECIFKAKEQMIADLEQCLSHLSERHKEGERGEVKREVVLKSPISLQTLPSKCETCQEDLPEDSIETSCGCFFCHQCFEKTVEAFGEIDTAGELRCPRPGCEKKLHIVDLASLDDVDAIRRWLRREVRMVAPDATFCPNCMGDADLNAKAPKAAYCRQCWTEYCPSCSGKPHGSESCYEARLSPEERKEFEAFFESLPEGEQENWRRCPHCAVPIYKAEGCDQMTCGKDNDASRRPKSEFAGCGRTFKWSAAEPYSRAGMHWCTSCKKWERD